jgi:hypothetical protein
MPNANSLIDRSRKGGDQWQLFEASPNTTWGPKAKANEVGDLATRPGEPRSAKVPGYNPL